MRNLLFAGWARLVRCKALWLSCAVIALYEVQSVLSRMPTKGEGWEVQHNLDGGFFAFAGMLGFTAALICAFFIGPEYSDGPMRNKILMGQRRRDVYLAHLGLSSFAALVVWASAILPGLILGLPLVGFFEMGAVQAVLMILGTCILSLAYAAIFSLVAMLIPNRAVSLTAGILLAIVLLVAGAYLNGRLAAPPTEDSGVWVLVDGVMQQLENRPNPDYLAPGPVRSLFAFLYNLLPGGQAAQYITAEAPHPERLIVYDGAIFLVTTAVGLKLFQEKDLQ